MINQINLKKNLIFVFTILFSICLINAVDYTPAPYDNVNLKLGDEYSALAYDSNILKFGETDTSFTSNYINLSESLTLDNKEGIFQNLIRSNTLDNILSSVGNSFSDLYRAFSDIINLLTLGERFAGFIKFISQDLNTELINYVMTNAFKFISQDLSISNVVNRMQVLTLSFSQDLNLDYALVRTQHLLVSISDSISYIISGLIKFRYIPWEELIFGFDGDAAAPAALGGSGGGGTSGKVLDYIVIEKDSEWIFDSKEKIYINAYNFNGELVEVENLTLRIMEDIIYIESETSSIGIGKFKKSYVIPIQSISNLTLKVTGEVNGKIVEQQYIIPLRSYDNFGEYLSDKLSFFDDYKYYFIFISILTFGIIILEYRRKTRKKKKPKNKYVALKKLYDK